MMTRSMGVRRSCAQADNRLRAWYAPSMQEGLLYTCSMGDVRPGAPCALLMQQKGRGEAEEVVPMDQLKPPQRDKVRQT